jgi:hypothetical protein
MQRFAYHAGELIEGRRGIGILKTVIATTRPVRYWIDSVSYRARGLAERLEPLRGRYAGRPMLVVGNGPSLNETPLERFLGVPAIGMNKIDLLFGRSAWRPALIVCMNNMVVRQHAQVFAESQVPVYISWKCRHFMPRQYRDRVDYFLSYLSSEFSADITQGVSSSATVTSAALQFAYFMGANPVILFGVDHSFNQQGSQFEYAKRSGRDENHFDPNYFKAGDWWGLPNLEASEMSYRLAGKAFAADGREILDATVGGRLTVYPKISVEEALEICEPQARDERSRHRS